METIYSQITNQIIKTIEANPGNPELPWRRSDRKLCLPENALTKKHYAGVNIISLWLSAQRKGYTAPLWASYKQWAEIGCQVRRGETASQIIFYKPIEDTRDPNNVKKSFVAKSSSVFNVDQVDGYTVDTPTPTPATPFERISSADNFIGLTKAKIEHGGDRAFYRPATDTIQMPDEALFTGTSTMSKTESYYSVLAHETVHWSGAEHRLNRDLKNRFGTEAYAAEELVAELGAAFLCAELGIIHEARPDHAQYIKSWLQLLKNDSKSVFTAAAKASEAVNYLKGIAK